MQEVCQAPLKEGGRDTPDQHPLVDPVTEWWLSFARAERASVWVERNGRLSSYSLRWLKRLYVESLSRENNHG